MPRPKKEQAATEHEQEPETSIGDLFTQYGSDKNTHHSYGPLYESLFPSVRSREKVKHVLEVGSNDGGCLLAWRDWFPHATVVGLEKEPTHNPLVGSEDPSVYPLSPRPERVEIHQGDLRNRDDLLRAVGGRQFDLIVEDATHLLPDNLLCLFWLWEFLAPGGLYVIEEMYNVQAHRDTIEGLFKGARLLVTGEPIPNELLVVVKKP